MTVVPLQHDRIAVNHQVEEQKPPSAAAHFRSREQAEKVDASALRNFDQAAAELC